MRLFFSWLLILGALLLLPSCGNETETEQITPPDKKDEPLKIIEPAKLDQPPLTARLVKTQYLNTINDLFSISLKNEEASLIPNELIDEKSFVTVFDSQPLQTDHIHAYALIARTVSQQIDLLSFADSIAHCKDVSSSCRKQLVTNIGKRLFRRPLNNDELASYQNLFSEIAEFKDSNFNHALAATLRAMLQAPQFIYRTEAEITKTNTFKTVSGYELASRLSYFIWQSTPDKALLDFAEKMEREGFSESALKIQVDRLFDDPKSERAMETFWSDYTLSSTSSILDASEQEANELRQSVLNTVKHASGANGEAATTLQQLFTSTQMVLTPNIAKSLGLPSKGSGYRVYDVADAEQRSGFLTHPGFLANIGSTSFVGRGTILTERVLCRKIDPPPNQISEAIDDTAEKTLSYTPREASKYRFDLGGICLDCHKRFEPIAFAFEQFDVLGHHGKKDDKGRALFTNGYLQRPNGDEGSSYDDVYGLTSMLEQSNEASECFVSNMLLFATGREYAQDDTQAISKAHQVYIDEGGTYESLLKSVALSPLFRTIQTVTE